VDPEPNPEGQARGRDSATSKGGDAVLESTLSGIAIWAGPEGRCTKSIPMHRAASRTLQPEQTRCRHCPQLALRTAATRRSARTRRYRATTQLDVAIRTGKGPEPKLVSRWAAPRRVRSDWSKVHLDACFLAEPRRSEKLPRCHSHSPSPTPKIRDQAADFAVTMHP
jgi:hypothetical protein